MLGGVERKGGNRILGDEPYCLKVPMVVKGGSVVAVHLTWYIHDGFHSVSLRGVGARTWVPRRGP